MPPDPPGQAIHVGTGYCRDALELTSRLAAALPFRPIGGSSRPAHPAPAVSVLTRPGVP